MRLDAIIGCAPCGGFARGALLSFRASAALIEQLNAQLTLFPWLPLSTMRLAEDDPGVVKRSSGWVCSRKVLSASRGCQRLGRVGSANCRPGRPFLGAMRARQV